jgi:hypothetical protein
MTFSLLADAEGKLVVASTVLPVGFGLVRYNTDGSLDTSFGDDGIVIQPGFDARGQVAALQDDGRILLMADANYNPTERIVLGRVHRDGSIDTTFGDHGRLEIDFPFVWWRPRPVLVSGGKLLLAGGADNGSNRDFVLGQLQLDTAPSFTIGADQRIDQDVGEQRIEDWATDISPGADGGSVRFEVASNANPGLFAAGPTLASNGTLTYRPATGAWGDAIISVRAVDDTGETSAEQSFRILVEPPNYAPVVNESFPFTLQSSPEDVRWSNGTSVLQMLLGGTSDGDEGALRGIAVTAADTTHGDWEFRLAGDTFWQPLLASPSAARLIPEDARLRFLPDWDFNGPVTLKFHAWDQTQGQPAHAANLEENTGGVTAFSSGKATATLTVTPVNDAPVLDSTIVTWWPKILEDTATPPERRVSTLLWGASDVDPEARLGIAVTAARNYWGTWAYKLSGSDNWQTMSHASATSAVLLPDDALVRYTPHANSNGHAQLYFHAWDQTAGAPGDTLDLTGQKGNAKSVSLARDAVSVDVTPVNDAPVLDISFNPTLNTIGEDDQSPVVTRVEQLIRGAISDGDEHALQGIAVVGSSYYHGTWQFFSTQHGMWVGMGRNDHSGAKMLTPETDIRFIPKPDFHGEVKLYYRAWDQTGRRADSRYNSGGSKHMSTEVEVATLKVLPDSDPPRLQVSGTVAYQRGAYQFQLAPQAKLRDADTFQFNGARLTVRTTTGADAGNKLFLGAHFSVDAQQQVLKEGKVIGRLTSNGQGLNHLEIRFNANANQAIVQEVVQMVMFQTEPTAKVGKRVLKFSFADADGEPTLTAWKTVNVTE